MKYPSCEVCGHGFAERHRLIPGSLGGSYTDWNTVWLCPNHHAAFHFVRTTARTALNARDYLRMEAYNADYAFVRFYNAVEHTIWFIDRMLMLRRLSSIQEASNEQLIAWVGLLTEALNRWRTPPSEESYDPHSPQPRRNLRL